MAKGESFKWFGGDGFVTNRIFHNFDPSRYTNAELHLLIDKVDAAIVRCDAKLKSFRPGSHFYECDPNLYRWSTAIGALNCVRIRTFRYLGYC